MPTPPTYHEDNPADAPILVLGLTSDILPITRWTTTPRASWRRRSVADPGRRAGRHRRRAEAGGPHPVRPGAARRDGLDLEDMRSALTNVSVDPAEGHARRRPRSLHLYDNDQILRAAHWDDLIIAYRNGATDPRARYRAGHRRAEERTLSRLGQRQARDPSRRPASSQAPTSSHGGRDQGGAAAAESRRFRRPINSGHLRSHRRPSAPPSHDVQFTLLLTIGAGRGGDLPVPAQSLGDGHPGASRCRSR